MPFDWKTNEALSWLQQFCRGDYCNTPKELVLGSHVLSDAYSRHLGDFFPIFYESYIPLSSITNLAWMGRNKNPRFSLGTAISVPYRKPCQRRLFKLSPYKQSIS